MNDRQTKTVKLPPVVSTPFQCATGKWQHTHTHARAKKSNLKSQHEAAFIQGKGSRGFTYFRVHFWHNSLFKKTKSLIFGNDSCHVWTMLQTIRSFLWSSGVLLCVTEQWSCESIVWTWSASMKKKTFRTSAPGMAHSAWPFQDCIPYFFDSPMSYRKSFASSSVVSALSYPYTNAYDSLSFHLEYISLLAICIRPTNLHVCFLEQIIWALMLKSSNLLDYVSSKPSKLHFEWEVMTNQPTNLDGFHFTWTMWAFVIEVPTIFAILRRVCVYIYDHQNV